MFDLCISLVEEESTSENGYQNEKNSYYARLWNININILQLLLILIVSLHLPGTSQSFLQISWFLVLVHKSPLSVNILTKADRCTKSRNFKGSAHSSCCITKEMHWFLRSHSVGLQSFFSHLKAKSYCSVFSPFPSDFFVSCWCLQEICWVIFFFFQISSFFYFPLSVFIRKCLICNLLSGEFLISDIKRAFCPLMRCLATICLEFRAENLLSPGAQTLALSKGVLHKWMVIKV